MRLTPSTPDILTIELPAQLRDVGGKVADDGRVLQEVVALGFAAPAVEGLVAQVHVGPVLRLPMRGHGASGHAVEIAEAGPEVGAGEELGGTAGAGVGREFGLGLGARRSGGGWV